MHISTPQGSIELSVCANTADGELFSNVSANVARGLPEVVVGGKVALICGGGPSLADSLEKISELAAQGAVVYALNNAAKFLASHGVKVHAQIILDARQANVEFVKDSPADLLYLASQCHPDLFKEATKPVAIWHPVIDGIEKHLPNRYAVQIGGGTTVGLSGLCLVYTLGHRFIHCFGYDSSYREDDSHAYEQALNKGQDRIRNAVNGRVFYSSVAMAAQAIKFPELVKELSKLGCQINVHGDGLLPHIMRTEAEEQAENPLQAVYDLGSSPPTYDFLPFLAEAEKYRVEKGYTSIDVTFNPGPMYGFRDDNLPPGIPEREGMLHRVCVAACRLLPSVRNVTIAKRRVGFEGEVFPVGWTNDNPKNHYGVQYLKDGHRCLTATKSAKDEIARRFPGRYATITLRQSSYWPERNSNMKAWFAAANYLIDMGVEPIFVPDTHGTVPAGLRAFDAAAWDIDLRLALYEGAEVNLGVANGPLALCMLSDAKYIMWKLLDPSGNAPAHSAGFYERFGVKVGDQFGDNGWLIWEDDTRESVIKGLHEWFHGKATMHEHEALAVNA